MKTEEIKQNFINFFRKYNHKYLKPSKVYNDDPTLFFVNSGMCQLKDIFLDKKEIDEKFNRMVNSQICIRAGGKKCDLEDVGKDSYHLTSFEMMGMWLLNTGSKEETIDLTYEYLVKECKINKDNIYITYFEGNEEIEEDKETKKYWSKYFNQDKIIPSKFKDNFWMMGDTGPCGVCTEVHVDLIGNRDASKLVNKDDPTVVEIWNNVFMEYNKTTNGFEKLKKFYVDHGSGLERLAMVLQNKTSVYQIDVFKSLFGYCQALTGCDFYTDKYDNNRDKAYRIFVDHMRTVVIALHQSVDFTCNKRGFILRKIFRRLLMNLYLYLNNNQVEQKFTDPLVLSLISYILNNWLEFTHDNKSIQLKLIDEEKIYINLLKNAKIKYQKLIKSFTDPLKIKSHMKNVNGIDSEILENLSQLKFI